MNYLRGCVVNQAEVAKDFQNAYKRCFAGDQNGSYEAIPAFVNGFFACELYLKILTDNKIKVHDLYLLFLGLNDEQKRKLCKQYEKNQQNELSFDEFLKKVNNGFEFWRYIYEDENKPFEENYPFLYSEKFLHIFLPLLEQMAKEHYLNFHRE